MFLSNISSHLMLILPLIYKFVQVISSKTFDIFVMLDSYELVVYLIKIMIMFYYIHHQFFDRLQMFDVEYVDVHIDR